MATKKVSNIKNGKKLTTLSDADKNRIMVTMASAIVERAKYAGYLGMSYGTSRDLYKALGYEKNPTFEHYNSKYERQDLARRIVEAYPSACWRKKPAITEVAEDETDFEKAWISLVKRRNIWHYLSRADKISGIGEYGIIVLGFDDGKELREPVDSAKELLYLFPYKQGAVKVNQWVEDTKDERYSLPELYSVNMARKGPDSSADILVHHSRIIHIAEGLTNDDVYGTPRLRSILNRLHDLELIVGGSAEMFWRGAFPGYALKAEPDADFGVQEREAIEEEVQSYMHDLRRYMKLQGIDVQELAQQVADPRGHFEIIIDVIAGATAIPKRILLGSERGELASSQDENAWNNRVAERREEFCEPVILRPLIDRLIAVGVLPETKEENYTVEWPDISAKTEKEVAEIDKDRMETFSKYMAAPGGGMIIPPEFFLQRHLGYTDEEIAQLEELRGREFKGDEEAEQEEEMEFEEGE